MRMRVGAPSAEIKRLAIDRETLTTHSERERELRREM